MLFSILIANFNNGKFFKDCYLSILNQTYTNWEVIIVDDASTDNSLDIIKKNIGEDKRFKLFENKINKGCGFTKNRCAKLANGEILGFLDPDDALYPIALAEMIEVHRKNLKAAIVTSKLEFVDMELNFSKNCINGEIIPNGKSYLTYGKGAFTAFATFKKDLYYKALGINVKMKRAVDQDLYYKMEEQGQHFFINKVLYKYRVHKGSISNNENLFKAKYWHFYARRTAYFRRKRRGLEIDNFTTSEIKRISAEYYLTRFRRIKFSSRTSNKIYLLLRSIYADPFHRLGLKLQSLILVIIGRI
ncbi:glycosyltransferase [Salegentibacter mishustinae]|uniref:glycosyltransferase n=1 Tax=Salegentibacter mishustinae TaxID=270918 RepID=UPI00248FBF51|nr:glycosyltransferase [Salegentibacter mishustinae]